MSLSPREIEDLLAKAIYADRNGKGCKPWSQRDARHKEPYLLDAKAVLTALEAEGMVVVPREPTWGMQIAGRDAILADDDDLDISTDDARASYRAMIAAAQGGDDAGQ